MLGFSPPGFRHLLSGLCEKQNAARIRGTPSFRPSVSWDLRLSSRGGFLPSVLLLPLLVGGWGLRLGLSPTSARLAPQGLSEIHDLTQVQDATGVSGQLQVAVEAPDLSDPATIRVDGRTSSSGYSRRERFLRSRSELSRRLKSARGRRFRTLSPAGLTRVAQEQLTRTRRSGKRLRELPAYDLAQVATVDPEDRAARWTLALLELRDPRPVARGPAGADRPGARRGRPPRSHGTGRRPASRSSSPDCR